MLGLSTVLNSPGLIVFYYYYYYYNSLFLHLPHVISFFFTFIFSFCLLKTVAARSRSTFRICWCLWVREPARWGEI